jgi:hypothetical protein
MHTLLSGNRLGEVGRANKSAITAVSEPRIAVDRPGLKLKEVTASDLFRRLNSYSKQFSDLILLQQASRLSRGQ